MITYVLDFNVSVVETVSQKRQSFNGWQWEGGGNTGAGQHLSRWVTFNHATSQLQNSAFSAFPDNRVQTPSLGEWVMTFWLMTAKVLYNWSQFTFLGPPNSCHISMLSSRNHIQIKMTLKFTVLLNKHSSFFKSKLLTCPLANSLCANASLWDDLLSNR